MKFSSKDIFTLPNILTYVRLLCVPIFIWLMLDVSVSKYHVFIAFGIFVFASLTDIADGAIARKFNLVSDIGKITDPLADKLLQLSTLICLSVLGYVHYAFVIILLLKEVYMALGGVIILRVFKSDYVIESNKWGKIATVINTIGIIAAFFHIEELKYLFYLDWVIIGIACVLSIYAAIQYTVDFIKYHKQHLNTIATSSSEDSAEDDRKLD